MFGTFLWFLVVSYCRILHFLKTKMALVVMVWYHILTVCLHLLHMILYFIYLGELHIKYTICTGPGQSRSSDLLTIIKATTKAHCLMCDKVGGGEGISNDQSLSFPLLCLPTIKNITCDFSLLLPVVREAARPAFQHTLHHCLLKHSTEASSAHHLEG